jgi:hypothetical protein
MHERTTAYTNQLHNPLEVLESEYRYLDILNLTETRQALHEDYGAGAA